MNFKKIFFVVLAASLIFTSCNKSSDLSDAIPADANYVVHVDMKSLIEKSEYDIFKNPTVQQGVNMYKALLRDEDKIKLLDEFLKDPNSLGLDVKKDLYIYTNYKVYGMVLGVNNSTKLKETLVKFSLTNEETIKKDGAIFSISPESGAAISWDDNRLIVIVDLTRAYGSSNQNPVNVEELSKTQLKQGSDKSVNSNKAFAEFTKDKKDISVFQSMNGLDEMPALVGMTGTALDAFAPFKKLLGEMKGISMGMYTSFEKGEVKLTSKYYYDTPEAEKKLKDITAKVSGILDGDHLKYVTSDPVFLASVNLKGEGIYDYLKDFGIIAKINEELPSGIQPEQIEKLVKGFNGDVTFVLSSVKSYTQRIVADDDFVGESFIEDEKLTMPQCMFFANVTDPANTISFLKAQLDENGAKYKELSPTVFLAEENGIKIYFGVNNNTFFATNIESVYNNLNSSDLKNNYSALTKDKSAVVYGDLQSLKPLLEENRDFAQILPLFNELGKYQFTTSANDLTGDGKVEFTTKDKNSLATICLQIDKMITNLGSSFGF